MKIFRVGSTGILRAKRVDGSVYAIIGSVENLLERQIIFDDNTAGNMEKWVGIENGGDIVREFDNKELAVKFYRAIN